MTAAERARAVARQRTENQRLRAALAERGITLPVEARLLDVEPGAALRAELQDRFRAARSNPQHQEYVGLDQSPIRRTCASVFLAGPAGRPGLPVRPAARPGASAAGVLPVRASRAATGYRWRHRVRAVGFSGVCLRLHLGPRTPRERFLSRVNSPGFGTRWLRQASETLAVW
jgi:hypothetical protein